MEVAIQFLSYFSDKQLGSLFLPFFFFPSVFGETYDHNNLFMSFLACSAPQCQTPKVLAQRLSPPLRSSHRVIESSSQVSPGQGLPGTGGRSGRKQGLPLGSPGLASWITQPKMGLEQVERKKNYLRRGKRKPASHLSLCSPKIFTQTLHPETLLAHTFLPETLLSHTFHTHILFTQRLFT